VFRGISLELSLAGILLGITCPSGELKPARDDLVVRFRLRIPDGIDKIFFFSNGFAA
jgi:hypothetical protein